MGVLSLEDARRLATERGLDLLLVSQESDPPVCRLVDYGQFKYEQQKKDKLAKKSSRNQVLKETKMSPKISHHDYMVRVNAIKAFLLKGHKVKVSVVFKGREAAHQELGHELIQKLLVDIADVGAAESAVSAAQRSLTINLVPKKHK